MIQKCSNWLVLSEFLKDPLGKHYVRSISRNIGLAHTSVKKHILNLEKENLVREKNDDLFKHYVANFDNDLFRHYKKMYTVTLLYNSKLIEYLDKKISPNVIILFGSAAKGEDTKKSDIDIYIEAKENKLDLSKFEKDFEKKIDLFFYQNINKVPKNLRNNIVNGTKLQGFLEIWT